VTANWQTQYYLTVTSAHGSPTPTSGWYAGGSSTTTSTQATADQAGGTRYRCTGYSGTGSAPASGTSNSATFVLNSPSSITWNWITQYQLTLNTVPVDVGSSQISALPISSDGFYDIDTNVALTAATTVPIDPASRYRFDQWSGPVTGSSNPTTVTMTAPLPVTANYLTEYYLTLQTTPLGVDTPNGAGWYETGQTVTISAISSIDIIPGQSHYQFNSWSGAVITDPLASSTTLTIGSTGQTVTANYIEQFWIQVNSAQDTPTTSQWVNQGGGLTVSVTSPTGIVTNDHQYICIGYTIDTETPVADGSSSHAFSNVQASHAITFDWKEQFWVTFAQTGLDNSVTDTIVTIDSAPKSYSDLPFNAWVDDSKSVQISASVILGHIFSSWSTSGMITVADPSSSSTTLSISGPGTVTANFL